MFSIFDLLFCEICGCATWVLDCWDLICLTTCFGLFSFVCVFSLRFKLVWFTCCFAFVYLVLFVFCCLRFVCFGFTCLFIWLFTWRLRVCFEFCLVASITFVGVLWFGTAVDLICTGSWFVCLLRCGLDWVCFGCFVSEIWCCLICIMFVGVWFWVNYVCLDCLICWLWFALFDIWCWLYTCCWVFSYCLIVLHTF